MKLTTEQIEDLKEQLDHHEQYSDCSREGGCCASELIELLQEILADAA